jgi:glucosamine--fructose-6-phosphate aminotransferase (isomerizing)
MCGIIAYKGKENAVQIILDGLKHLEYRGYDSSGLCIISKNKAFLIKKTGQIDNLLEAVKKKQSHNEMLSGEIGISHSRWATHGAVTEANAHPHFSCNKNIFVVHNGIVENYEGLKEELIKKGHHFVSQTDTEVIPHLIEEYRKNNSFVVSCEKTFQRLEGLFAIVALDKKTGEIVGTRNGSPLVMGIGKGGLFLASDIPAFLDKTNKVIFLDDGDMVHIINGEEYKIKNLISKKYLKKTINIINWTKEEAEKGKHPHFMIKEIKEIPEAIKKAAWQDKKILQSIVNLIKKSSGVFFIGCGTAGHSCLLGQYLFSSLLGKRTGFSVASEFKNFLPALDKNTLLIAVSQSGETIDTIEAVKKAREKGIKVVSLVNVMGSTLTRISDYVLMINAGPEKCVLATKSYLSQIALILLIVFSVLGQEQKAGQELKKISRQLNQLLEDKKFISQIKKLAKQLCSTEHIFAIGRSYNYPTTLETALKIKEGCYIHTEAFAGGELKHGVIALIEKGTPCIVHLSKSEEEENTLINAMELQSRGAYIIGIGPEKKKDFDFFITVPEVEEFFSPLVNIVPAHLLSYYIALEKGIDPDKPRNLAKSVTVK